MLAFAGNRVESIFHPSRTGFFARGAARFSFEAFSLRMPAAARLCQVLVGCVALLASLATAAQVDDREAPSVPTGLTAVASSNVMIQLGWKASTDNVGVTQYTLHRDGALVYAPVVLPASTACAPDTSAYPYFVDKTCSQADNGTYTLADYFLAPAKSYGYTVAACDAAGNCSAQSAAATATTLPGLWCPGECPPTPLLMAAAVSSSQINVMPRYQPRVGASQFKLYRDGTLLISLAKPFSELPFADITVAPSTGYSYTATECDAAGACTAQSPSVSVTTPAASAEPDVQAPAVPTALSAGADSVANISLNWSPATDNVGVAAYRIFRDGVLRSTLRVPLTSFTDTGLAAAASYSYTVAACDFADNCSAQSAPATATTAAAQRALTLNLAPGWNLLGNSLLYTWLDVVAAFGNPVTPVAGITENINSIWTWNATLGRWAFYSPRLTLPASVSYAAGHNYDALYRINSGEGFWVNVAKPITLPLPGASNISWRSVAFGSLPAGFNLISTSENVTPSSFNALVNRTPPLPGEIPTGNFTTLWAWDAPKAMWYFYAPSLQSAGGLPAVKSYADAHGYLHFEDYNKSLGIGTGFWVNKMSATLIQFSTIAAGWNSGVTTAQNVVVRDASAWASLWANHTSTVFPQPQLPAIDFNTQMVLGVFLGARSNGCYSMQIPSVAQVSGKITVEYQENTPAAGAICTQVITFPFQLIAVPRSSDTVEFIKTVR